ncbi:MAG TPA: hypothetical protein VN428_17825 [Bryobacteraceae bacterium]|nr:hypothetical protein [Bryobacteraceae bacterium]
MPAPAGKKGSPLVKVLLIVLGVFVLCGALLAAGLIYAGFRIKNKVEQTARQHGVDLHELANPGKAARRVDPCTLLTTGEAAEIIGVPIERTQREESGSSSTCHYWGVPAKPEESREQISRSLQAMEATPSGDRRKGMEALENVTKSILGGVTGQSYFAVQVDWEGGKAGVAALKLITAAEGPDMAAKNVAGIGDTAAFGPLNSTFLFSKGATAVQIDLRLLPDGREKALRMAKLIESRL